MSVYSELISEHGFDPVVPGPEGLTWQPWFPEWEQERKREAENLRWAPGDPRQLRLLWGRDMQTQEIPPQRRYKFKEEFRAIK